MTNSPNDITRRSFINKASRGLLATTAAEALLKTASAQLRVPDPPGKKLGWAIVGLGSLSINQILPAFAKCEKSKVVALVSGHPDKASKLALRYGVSPKNIYNYQNYDSIKDNPDVDIIYIVLPNGMHAEYTVRGHQAGKDGDFRPLLSVSAHRPQRVRLEIAFVPRGPSSPGPARI